jgi:glycosyltransferase involved in cell wall biosynthesis
MAAESRSMLGIGLVGPLAPPSGGMASQCEQLLRLLKSEGLRVELVQTNRPFWPGVVGRLPLLRAIFRLVPFVWKLWRVAGRVDVMHIFANSGWAWYLMATPALIVAHWRGKPSIIHYHGGNADRFFSRAPRHALAMLRTASLRVTPSVFLQGVFHRHKLGAEVIPNAIDLNRFLLASHRSLGISPHLIVTRNLESIYDISTAIRAFAIIRRALPGAHMTIAGSGPELSKLQAEVMSQGLDGAVQFSGRIDNDLIVSLYASADCMLNPSRVDNMPISILEAFASGVPVVSTDVGGIPDLVIHGASGLLVPAGDYEAMAREALRVLQTPVLASTLRANGLSQAQRYGWSQVRSKWLMAYAQLTHCGSA